MEDEISIGEYVRTKLGDIKKITKGFEFIIERHNKSDNKIVKHSKNIIDLIEVGDYVNGGKVTAIREWTSSKEGTFRYAITLTYDLIRQKDIKSILTKELYNANCYELEE